MKPDEVAVPRDTNAIPTGVWVRRELVEALREAVKEWDSSDQLIGWPASTVCVRARDLVDAVSVDEGQSDTERPVAPFEPSITLTDPYAGVRKEAPDDDEVHRLRDENAALLAQVERLQSRLIKAEEPRPQQPIDDFGGNIRSMYIRVSDGWLRRFDKWRKVKGLSRSGAIRKLVQDAWEADQ